MRILLDSDFDMTKGQRALQEKVQSWANEYEAEQEKLTGFRTEVELLKNAIDSGSGRNVLQTWFGFTPELQKALADMYPE
jgi:hypothetical protein